MGFGAGRANTCSDDCWGRGRIAHGLRSAAAGRRTRNSRRHLFEAARDDDRSSRITTVALDQVAAADYVAPSHARSVAGYLQSIVPTTLFAGFANGEMRRCFCGSCRCSCGTRPVQSFTRGRAVDTSRRRPRRFDPPAPVPSRPERSRSAAPSCRAGGRRSARMPRRCLAWRKGSYRRAGHRQ
jgi:hypothetical protein